MKNLLYILFLFTIAVQAQRGLYNGSGAIRIHNDGNIGFHTNLINDAAFDQDQGLVGFYGNEVILVSGSIPPTFQDMEVMVPGNMFLQNSINVKNNVNFIDGDVLTPQNVETLYLILLIKVFLLGKVMIPK